MFVVIFLHALGIINYFYNIPEFIMKNQQDYIEMLKEEIKRLSEENKRLNEEINDNNILLRFTSYK